MGIIPEKKNEKIVWPFEEYTMLIYGLPGSGKTTFCNGDTESVTIAAEPGADFVQTRVVPCYKWSKFMDVAEELKTKLNADKNFASGVVIDIVDNLYEQCRDYVCQELLGIQYPGEKKDFGKSWADVSKEWRTWLTFLMSFTSVRFISHVMERPVDRPNEHGLIETINQFVPRFNSGQGAKFLDGVCHMVGFMYTNKKSQHCITFKQHASLVVKDRTGVLRDFDEIVLPDDPTKGFEHVKQLFEKTAIEKGLKIKSKRGEINDYRQ